MYVYVYKTLKETTGLWLRIVFRMIISMQYECAACISVPRVSLEVDNDENITGCISSIYFIVFEVNFNYKTPFQVLHANYL
jgi:hypothetical protein